MTKEISAAQKYTPKANGRTKWQKGAKEIRQISALHSRLQESNIELTTMIGRAYEDAIFKFFYRVKNFKVPQINEKELFDTYVQCVPKGEDTLKKKFFLLLMRKYCTPLFWDNPPEILCKLDWHCKHVIKRKYFDGVHSNEIKREMNISTEMLSVLEEKALEALKIAYSEF